MPIYKKAPGKWRVVVWTQGKARERIVEGSKADAEAFEAQMRLEAPAGEFRAVPTLSDFTRLRYSPHAAAHLKARTLKNRTYQLATLEEHLGDVRLDRIRTAEIDAFKAARTRAGIRPSTVNDDLKVLTAILNYARSLDMKVPEPAFKPLPVPVERRNASPWSREEVDALLRSCASLDPELLPVLVFLLNTGCRKGEAIALEWANVDLEHGIVKIWASEEWQPKDGDNREVPVNAALLPYLAGARRHPRWVFPTDKLARPRRFAFWPQRRFDRVREAALLTGGPHKCRHTYATHFLAAIPDLYLLGRVMGHSHTHVTELYGHLLSDALRRAAGAVNFPAPPTP